MGTFVRGWVGGCHCIIPLQMARFQKMNPLASTLLVLEPNKFRIQSLKRKFNGQICIYRPLVDLSLIWFINDLADNKMPEGILPPHPLGEQGLSLVNQTWPSSAPACSDILFIRISGLPRAIHSTHLPAILNNLSDISKTSSLQHKT